MHLSKTLNLKASYDVSFLINVLKENKTAHIEEYSAAMEEYLKQRAAKAQKIVLVADKIANDPTVNSDDLNKAYNSLYVLKEPVNAVKMYDDYINLLTTSISSSIELTMEDANTIINDAWDWAVSAKLTNSTYLAGASWK